MCAPLKQIFTGLFMAPWEIILEHRNSSPTFQFICCFRGDMLFKNHYPDDLRPEIIMSAHKFHDQG